jgi:hypothetical protein
MTYQIFLENDRMSYLFAVVWVMIIGLCELYLV